MFNVPGKSMFNTPRPFGRSPARRPSYSAEAQQFFDRLITPPDAGRKALYASLIDSLVATGVWAILDQLFVAATDETTMLTNLVRSSNYASRNGEFEGGTLNFTPDRGFQGPDSGINPNIAADYVVGGNWSRDSASWFGWVIGAGDAPVFSSALVNGTGGANELLLGAYSGTAFSSARINSTTGTFSATDTNGRGLYLATRTGATSVRYDKNGVNLATNSTASTAPANTGFRCSYSHDRPLGAFGTGGGMDAAQSAALYSALNEYLTAIGAV